MCSSSSSHIGELDFGPFQDGKVLVSRDKNSFSLYYRIYNFKSDKAPLVVVHGGPSLPSQYLYPIVPLLKQERPIIFYDQLGCGRSDQPTDLSNYSTAKSVLDLETVTTSLIPANKSFHILGHSYGGSLAYDFVCFHSKEKQPLSSVPKCQSLILSNAAQTMKTADSEYDRFYKQNPKTYWTDHVCRVGMPPVLKDAFQNLGKVWGGMADVLDYVAQPMDNDDPNIDIRFPDTLVISCSHDFGFITSNEEAWKPVIKNNKLKAINMNHCAHYPFYEDGETFGRIVEEFLDETEGKMFD